MAKYDAETGLQLLEKQTGESRNFQMDFSKALDTGETISSIVGVAVTPLRDVIGSISPSVDAQAIVGDSIQLAMSGGTHRERYRVDIQVLTSQSETIEGEGILLVKDK